MLNLFTPLRIREVSFRNRIFVAPMCQYSANNGIPNDWHLVHLGSRAVGGAGLVIVEAAGVSPEARISHGDLGIWNNEQVTAYKKLTQFLVEQDCVPGIQLAHAGRKASSNLGWLPIDSLEAKNSWSTVGPSAIAFSKDYKVPKELSEVEIEAVVNQFISATRRSLQAGFKVVEIHMAHGYLLHQFLSPISNQRTDFYGGSLENRMRLPLRVAEEVRKAWPSVLPVFVRISVTDWIGDGGWQLSDSIELTKRLKGIGIDLIDCSAGGNTPDAKIPVGPGYQVPFAEAIKKEVKILTGAVGLITEAGQANKIVGEEKADVVLLGRELLRDPYWPLHAAKELGIDVEWPRQYQRAKV